jgi:hypothetical protein
VNESRPRNFALKSPPRKLMKISRECAPNKLDPLPLRVVSWRRQAVSCLYFGRAPVTSFAHDSATTLPTCKFYRADSRKILTCLEFMRARCALCLLLMKFVPTRSEFWGGLPAEYMHYETANKQQHEFNRISVYWH